ncbi:hypothetical protein GOB94_14410 [Granulicella sp. 5B5]|uniref:hypothetical protein n=1 Tax=Granulicella sp. 5B5 TaxID=1617967 RepID=UPI0015F3F9DC|nr:hypothetical protein [Granulicella sp. 5B5]QMV19755.1 hypothetical protein GOB94_14410 [Granulicella sp. 5B5]
MSNKGFSQSIEVVRRNGSNPRLKALSILSVPSVLAVGAASTMLAYGQIAVQNQGYVPFSDAPINYRTSELHDPVALLQRQLDSGKASLKYEPQHGYLRSVLQLLKVPIDSQTLVFSKTSFQYKKISPDHPRALYFNDDVYVGSVHDGKAIEIVSFDPLQGAVFYLLDEHKVAQPVFQRAELDCTQCHIAAGTRGVPGVLLRSIYPTETGTQATSTPSYITDQESPFKERWGGWYVTGKLGNLTSMANAAVPDSSDPTSPAIPQYVPVATTKLVALNHPFDPSTYLIPGSDVVAQLVLAHQTQMHNLITLTNYKTRIALYTAAIRNKNAGKLADTSLPDDLRLQFERPAEQLLRYLLFVNEAPLPGSTSSPIVGSSTFALTFAARGIRDAEGRSLRDFDLHTRIFKYPCSYLIYTDSFDQIPEPAKSYIYHRLFEILAEKDQSPDFAKISHADKRAIFEILLATKPGLPTEWKDYARSNHLRIAAAPTPPIHPDANQPG